MKNALLIMILFPYMLTAQIEWASGVEFTTSASTEQGNPNAYQGIQATGAPNVAPWTNQSSQCAWSPSTNESDYERITVKFSGKTKARQIVINENLNPGSIIGIEAYDPTNVSVFKKSEKTGFKRSNDSLPLNILLEQPINIAKVMITLNPALVPGSNQIDAVGLTANSSPYRININQVDYQNFKGVKEALNSQINSPTDELCPVISPDGKTIYFTRQNHPENIEYANGNQDIWMAEIKADGSQGSPKSIPTPINNQQNNALASITPDGQRVLLLNEYYPDGTMQKGLSTSRKKGNDWEFPENLKIDKYYNDNVFGEYYLLPNAQVLLLTIQRNDGQGGKDVHISFLKEDDTWTEPKNLGKVINTAASETSPFLAADERTLYFASRGHMGYGSSDVFVSRRIGESWFEWTTPQNLGPLINTSMFDAYYTIPASGSFAYFTNNTNTGKSDIFRIALPESAKPKPVALIKGHVYDAETKKPLASAIYYELLDPVTPKGKALSNLNDGFYSITLPGGEFYGFQARAEGYYPVSQNLNLKDMKNYQEMDVDLYLHPIKVGQTIKLNNVFFDHNQYSFQKTTFAELDRLATFLNASPSIKIRIEGHTDDQGEDAYNMTLSKNRAKAVHDYLLSKKVNPEKISYKGYGEEKPITRETTASARAKNRRVEFYIEKL